MGDARVGERHVAAGEDPALPVKCPVLCLWLALIDGLVQMLGRALLGVLLGAADRPWPCQMGSRAGAGIGGIGGIGACECKSAFSTCTTWDGLDFQLCCLRWGGVRM